MLYLGMIITVTAMLYQRIGRQIHQVRQIYSNTVGRKLRQIKYANKSNLRN